MVLAGPCNQVWLTARSGVRWIELLCILGRCR